MGATHNYKNSRAAKLAIYELGEDIKAGKLPAHFGPLSFVFSGSGNVSQVGYASTFAVHVSPAFSDVLLHTEIFCELHGIFLSLVTIMLKSGIIMSKVGPAGSTGKEMSFCCGTCIFTP